MNAYIWQMNDCTWRISALGGRPSLAIAADQIDLDKAGLGRAYATRQEAEAALRTHRYGVDTLAHRINQLRNSPEEQS